MDQRSRDRAPLSAMDAGRMPSSLTVSNLTAHTTGDNRQNYTRNVRAYLSGLHQAGVLASASKRNHVRKTEHTHLSRPNAVQSKRVRELSNGSGSGSLPKSDQRSQSPIVPGLPYIRPQSRGSLHASMKSRRSLDGQPQPQNSKDRKSGGTPELKPRKASIAVQPKADKGKSKVKQPSPVASDSMSTSSDDEWKRQRRTQGLSDKSDTASKTSQQLKNMRRKIQKGTKGAHDQTVSEGDGKTAKSEAKADKAKKARKESVDPDREQGTFTCCVCEVS